MSVETSHSKNQAVDEPGETPKRTVQQRKARIPWNIEPHLRQEHVVTEVADGIYRICSSMTNIYLIERDEGLTVVDAGLPAQMELLESGLERIGAELSDIKAVILTHVDPDHIGLAEPLRQEGIPIWVPEKGYESALAGIGKPPLGFFFFMWRPAYARFMRAMMQAGLTEAEPIAEATIFDDGDVLDVPGHPEVIYTPGHREEHCSFWLPESRILFSGDALITMDIMSGKAVDPEPVRGGNLFNFNKGLQMESARKLGDLGHVTLLSGHGDPWEGDLGKLYPPV